MSSDGCKGGAGGRTRAGRAGLWHVPPAQRRREGTVRDLKHRNSPHTVTQASLRPQCQLSGSLERARQGANRPRSRPPSSRAGEQRGHHHCSCPSWIRAICLRKWLLTFQTFHSPQPILLFLPWALDWVTSKPVTKIPWFKGKTLPMLSRPSLKTNFGSKYASSLSDSFTELLFSTMSQTLAARWHEAGMGKKLNHKHRQPYLAGLAPGGLKPANPATNHRIPELLSTPAASKIQDYLPPSFPVTSRWNIEGHQPEGNGMLWQHRHLLRTPVGQGCSQETHTFAPCFRISLHLEAERSPPPCCVSQTLVTFQNINLSLIKGCLNPRKLLKYASILLIWDASNRL